MWSPVTDLDVPSSGHLPTNSSPPVSPCDPSSAETFYKQLIAEDTQGHSADGKPLCLEGTVDAPWCSSWILNVAIWHGEKKKTAIHRKPQRYIPCLPPQPPTSMLWSEVPSIINRNGCFWATLNWGTWGTWPLWCGTSWDGVFFCLLKTRYDGIRDEVRFFIVMSHASLLAFISNVFSSRKTTFICIYILMFTIYTRIYDKIKRIWMHMICVMCI